MESTTLVIFDFSGTLSLETVDFGQPEALERHLANSGLAAVGIDTADCYWQTVVNPTWPAASTTGTGFVSLAADCIRQQALPGVTTQAIDTAVETFVAAYMRHSKIDATWHTLLKEIGKNPMATGIIATDHYAEATGAIQKEMAALGIGSSAATIPDTHSEGSAFIVANSADIGYLKADLQFWLMLKQACPARPISSIILVDDFGANEQDLSGYTGKQKIQTRLETTGQAIDSAFGVRPQVFQFITGKDPDRAIIETCHLIRNLLP